MMGLRLLFMLFVLILLSCETEKKEQNRVSVIETCQDIFYNMPNSFDEFVEMYGYSEEDGEGSLSHKPQNISIAFNCPEVSATLKLRKAIKISMEGEWQEQGVSLFQKEMQRLVVENKELTNAMLESFSEQENKSFWQFFFDEPLAYDQEAILRYNELFKSEEFVQEQKDLMEVVYAEVVHQSRRKKY